ncbi:MAG: hypothetical protein ACXVDN_16425 [Ktedonobacteraceae bacterium]
MSRTFKSVDYALALDLTVRVGDCLPPDHLTRFMVDSVATPDLTSQPSIPGMGRAVGNPSLVSSFACKEARKKIHLKKLRMCEQAEGGEMHTPESPRRERTHG